MDYREQNNYPKAFAATGVILAVVIALCYFIVFKNPPPEQEGTGGILVNYGTVDEGMGNDYMSIEEPSVAENANQSKPDKVTETPPTEDKPVEESSDKNVVTQNNEDAPEVAANSKAKSKTVATQPVTKPIEAPKVNQNALYKGKTNNGSGEGDGTGSTPGNQGVPTGSNLTPDYGPGGDGGNGKLAMSKRRFTYAPKLVVNQSVVGTLVIDIKVDKDGNVISAGVGRGSKVGNPAIIQQCIDLVKTYKINRSEDAEDQQIGKVVFQFNTN
jgi:outer membrane biosynthesis protein TonB